MHVVLLAMLAILILGHGLIHLWWLSPPNAEAATLTDPANAWPTRWGLDVGLVRGATLLLALTAFGLYALSAAGTMGWLVGPSTWRWATLVASVVSLALILAYWDKAAVIGLAIDLVLIAALVADLPARIGIPRGA